MALAVANPSAVAKVSEPVTSGVPFAQGALQNAGAVRLYRGTAEVPVQALVTARWPDRSIRWLLLDFQTDLPASGSVPLVLRTGTSPAAVTGITVTNLAASLRVNTGTAEFVFDKSSLVLGARTFQAVYGNQTYTAVPDAASWVVEESGPMKSVARVDGTWRRGSAGLRDTLIRFRARLSFYRNKSWARVAFTFKNNNSFGWDNGQNKRPDLALGGLSLGDLALLPAGGRYVFGSGVEKTFEILVPSSGAPSNVETRYAANGSVASGRSADRPLALASPAYYASTSAWGRIVLPLAGLPAARQSEFARFEKLQRAQVLAADVENPPGLTGITAFGHLSENLGSWNDYGCLRWGGEDGPISGNHYDWVYSMYLQAMRTGVLPFANIARVMARHEIDFDIYHTTSDGEAFNRQKNWESRPSHDSSDNTFGGGRPTHTWSQGYALHWLLTGDPRGRDGYEEILDGVRRYLYESFNGEGRVATNEIRTQGWIVDNLITQWRIDPAASFATSGFGNKTVPAAIKDTLTHVFLREAAAGGHGFVYAGDENFPDPALRQPLQNCYFIEPGAKAYEEVFAGRDDVYAAQLLALLKRMTRFLMGITYGGNNLAGGLYRPLQIPEFMASPTERALGQVPYLLMAANAAGFCHLHGAEPDFLPYMRKAFQDYSRYCGAGGDDGGSVSPGARAPTSYNSNIYVDTESKVRGWSGRYGAFVLAAEIAASSSPTGFFNGLVGDGTLGTGSGAAPWFVARNGFFSATVGGDLSVGGQLRLDGVDTPVTAGFDGFGRADFTVSRTGKSPARIRLGLYPAPSKRISGNVTVNGTVMPLEALPCEFTGATGSVSPLNGRRYNVALKPQAGGPAGYGYGSLTFSSNGTGTFSGKLADGTGFTASARSGDDLLGNWIVPVEVPLYTNTGIFWGELALPKTTPAATVADVTGELAWIRPADAAAASFRLGINTAVDALGARYLPVAGQSLLTGTSAIAPFHLAINGVGRTPATLTANGTWTAANAATLTAPPAGTTWAFAPATGLFTGNFTYGSGATAAPRGFEGLLLTKPLLGGNGTIRGAGFHTGGNSSAAVLLSK